METKTNESVAKHVEVSLKKKVKKLIHTDDITKTNINSQNDPFAGKSIASITAEPDIHYNFDDPRYSVQQKTSKKFKTWNLLPIVNGLVDLSMDLHLDPDQIPSSNHNQNQYKCPKDGSILLNSFQGMSCPQNDCASIFQKCPICPTDTWMKLINYNSHGHCDYSDSKRNNHGSIIFIPSSTPNFGRYIDRYVEFDWACNGCRGRFHTSDSQGLQEILWKTNVLCESCGQRNMSGSNEEGYICSSEKCGGDYVYKFQTDVNGHYMSTKGFKNYRKDLIANRKNKKNEQTEQKGQKEKTPNLILELMTRTPRFQLNYQAPTLKRKDINNDIFCNSKQVQVKIGDIKHPIMVNKIFGQDLKFNCTCTIGIGFGKEIECGEEGFVCPDCWKIYNICDTCSYGRFEKYSQKTRINWMTFKGWQMIDKDKLDEDENEHEHEEDSSDEDLDESILTQVQLPPYIPLGKGKDKYMDDSSIFHWLCENCGECTTTHCD